MTSGQATRFIGLEIARDRPHRTIYITQSSYIQTLLTKFRMEQCNPSKIPSLTAHCNRRHSTEPTGRLCSLSCPYRGAPLRGLHDSSRHYVRCDQLRASIRTWVRPTGPPPNSFSLTWPALFAMAYATSGPRRAQFNSFATPTQTLPDAPKLVDPPAAFFPSSTVALSRGKVIYRIPSSSPQPRRSTTQEGTPAAT